MHLKMLTAAVAAGLGLYGFAAPAAAATDAEELARLKAQLLVLQQKVDAMQAAPAPAPAAAQDAGVEKLAKLVNDTSVSGKMFFDFSNISQKYNDSGKTDKSGLGLDVKRFYLGIDHKFNDVWSANLTTDFNYVANDGQTNLFVKKAYLQGKFSKAAVLRIGSADMPWIPFAEKYYGFRYVENTLTDRLKYGNSADWGVHLGGAVGQGGGLDYAVSVVNGNGYKNPGRSKGVDVEARVGYSPVKNLVLAVGGYSGKRGQETQNIDAQHTAQRGDLMVAWASDAFRLGAEYFTAKDWNQVTSPKADKASGYSVWGSVPLNETLTAFARYDSAKLSKTLDPRNKDTYYNLGLQFAVTKGFDLAAVWKHETAEMLAATPVPAHVRKLKTDEIGVYGQLAF